MTESSDNNLSQQPVIREIVITSFASDKLHKILQNWFPVQNVKQVFNSKPLQLRNMSKK